MAEVTLNKDGSPRKKGSGKTKGAGCFTKMKWSELREYVGENVSIPISRVWLRSLGVPVDEGKPEAGAETSEEAASVKDLNEPAETVEETTESVEEIDEPVEETPEPLEETEEPAEESPEATEEMPESQEEVPPPLDESEDEEAAEEDSPPIGAVTPPYRYAQDFDL